MPGLGGRAAAAAHVAGSARVIRAVAQAAPAGNPLVVRLRTAAVVPSTPLGARAAAGEFVLPDDVEVAQELRDLLDQLGDSRFELRSDHMLNLLQELEGSLPRDRERLIALLDDYLGWPRDDQARFAVGVRLGVFRRLADYADEARRRALDRAVRRVRAAERRRAAAGGVGAPLPLHLTAVSPAAAAGGRAGPPPLPRPGPTRCSPRLPRPRRCSR